MPTITSLVPTRVVEGGRVALTGSDLPTEVVPSVVVGQEPARTLFASSTKIVIDLPPTSKADGSPVRIENVPGETVYLSVGSAWATGLHQVDNPVFDREGNLFVTYSGSRGQEAPISVFRVTPAGTREPFVSGIVNATSMAFGPDGHLYVSSRFEGAVYRVNEDGTHKQVAADLGVACGLAFDADGWMYVGDRSGTIFRIRDGDDDDVRDAAAERGGVSSGDESVKASCSSADRRWAPTTTFIASATTARFAPSRRRSAGRRAWRLRPDGSLHVIDALAGASGLYRFATPDSEPELVVSGGALVGVAFGPNGELVVSRRTTPSTVSNRHHPTYDTPRQPPSPRLRRPSRRGLSAVALAEADDLSASVCPCLENPYRLTRDMQLFARKPIADLQPPDGPHSLKRVLGAGDLIMLAIGAVIGAGHLRRDRHRRGRTGRTGRRGHPLRRGAGADLFVRAAGRRLRAGGALLRGAGVDDSAGRAAPTPTPTPRSASWWRGSSAGT